MELLLIEGTKNSPRIELNPSGEIKIHGRCLAEDSKAFFSPIIDWVNRYSSKIIKIEFQLEYFNSSSLVQILSLLTIIVETKIHENIEITWFYEQDDEDIYELGKTMESQLNLHFNFVKYSEEV